MPFIAGICAARERIVARKEEDRSDSKARLESRLKAPPDFGPRTILRRSVNVLRIRRFLDQGSRGISPSATRQTQGVISGLASIMSESACS